MGTSAEDYLLASSEDDCNRDWTRHPRMPQRISFGNYSRDTCDGNGASLNIDFGYIDAVVPTSPLTRTKRMACSSGSLDGKVEDSTSRRISGLANSIKSFLSICSKQHRDRDRGMEIPRRHSYNNYFSMKTKIDYYVNDTTYVPPRSKIEIQDSVTFDPR